MTEKNKVDISKNKVDSSKKNILDSSKKNILDSSDKKSTPPQKLSESTKELKKIATLLQPKKKTWWQKLLLLILLIIIIILIFQAVIPLIQFKPWFDWWKTYGGNKYKQCFDLTSMAYYQNFVLFYYIRGLMIPGESKPTEPEIIFIGNLLRGQAIGIVPGGHITPKTICETIIPDVKMKHSLEDRGITPAKGFNPDANGWPDANDSLSWKNLIASFATICWEEGNTISYCAKDGENWAKDPDNFLVRQYSIPWNSRIVMAFITGWATDSNNQKLYPTGLSALLGSAGEGVDGWYGFLRSFDTGPGGFSYEDIATELWAIDVPHWMPKSGTSGDPSKVCNSTSSQVASGLQGAQAALGIGIACAMIPGVGWGIGALITIGAAAAGYAQSRASKGCKVVGAGAASKTCFTGETKILMNDYSYKNMEDIKIGDIVISGKTGKCVKVIFKDSQNVDKINIYSFNNGKFFTTESHSFIDINNDDKLTISNEDYMREVKKMVDTTQISKGNKIKTVNGPEKINNIKSKLKKNIQLYDLVTEDFSYTANDYCVFTAFPFDQNTKLTIITGKILLDDCKTPEIALKEFENSSETFENLLKRFFENATKDKSLINKGKELFRSNYEKYGKKQTKNLAEICYINC